MCLRESERNRAATSASTKGSNKESNSAGLLSGIGGCADILDVPPVAEIGPLQANKKHSFHNWRGKERREALSISGAERSLRARKRARRGFGVCAAQSCTSGIDSRSRPQLKTSP